MKKLILPFVILTILASCQQQQKPQNEISKEEMLNIVTVLDQQFIDGTRQKDSALLTNIYSDSAQYIQPYSPFLTGKQEIGKDWGAYVKSTIFDIEIKVKDVRGTREIIYETGTGTSLYLTEKGDTARYKFNYLNLWRLQNDGSYKLEVDIYTPLKN